MKQQFHWLCRCLFNDRGLGVSLSGDPSIQSLMAALTSVGRMGEEEYFGHFCELAWSLEGCP